MPPKLIPYRAFAQAILKEGTSRLAWLCLENIRKTHGTLLRNGFSLFLRDSTSQCALISEPRGIDIINKPNQLNALF
jgi:hypothetical protein